MKSPSVAVLALLGLVTVPASGMSLKHMQKESSKSGAPPPDEMLI